MACFDQLAILASSGSHANSGVVPPLVVLLLLLGELAVEVNAAELLPDLLV